MKMRNEHRGNDRESWKTKYEELEHGALGFLRSFYQMTSLNHGQNDGTHCAAKSQNKYGILKKRTFSCNRQYQHR